MSGATIDRRPELVARALLVADDEELAAIAQAAEELTADPVDDPFALTPEEAAEEDRRDWLLFWASSRDVEGLTETRP